MPPTLARQPNPRLDPGVGLHLLLASYETHGIVGRTVVETVDSE